MNRSVFSFNKWLGFIIAALVAGVSAILGWVDDVPMQNIVFYALAIFALILWVWHHPAVHWIPSADAMPLPDPEGSGPGEQ